MDIISYDFKNVALNILKNSFFLTLHTSGFNIWDNFFDNLITSHSRSMLKLKLSWNKIILKTLNDAIPKIDKAFLNSDYRKANFYKSNSHNRTIYCIFGELNFNRNYYTDKSKKNGFYLIDELFKFEKYTTYDPLVRSILINNSVKTNANISSNETSFLLGDYASYLDNNSFNNISRQTIYNWINKWNIPKVNYDYIEGHKRLYVMVDEKWIHEQIRLDKLSDEERGKHHYIMGKCFVTFTGAITKNNRTTLLNRHIFMTSNSTPWKSLIDEIFYIYNFEEIEEIYLLSDCGSWILAGAKDLKLFKNNKVIKNTCEFHVKQYINRMTHSKEKRGQLIKSIYEDKDKKRFIELADEIIESAKNKEKKIKYKNYVINHWKSILNMKDREIKSSMESHISHCMASAFGSRPKGFSRKRIESYIKLQEYKLNGINIMDLYLHSYNKKEEDNLMYNKEEVSFSNFERTSSNIPVRSSANPISMLINSIALGN